ncbi:MAG: hypothetical protein K8M05_13345 [Deltaproteobacteria bacterium]|nr:hypothetical protein [Kofleriaceae bacterium]
MRRLAAFLPVLAAVLVPVTVARADADSLNDPLGPREVALGEGMRAGAVGAMATTLNPAGLPLTRELVFEGSFGYRPDDSASLVGLAACDSTNALPGCFYYHYAGMSPDIGGMELGRRTHVGGMTLSRPINSRINIGAGAKYFDFESDNMAEEDASGWNWDVGVTVRLTEILNVAAVGYNLFGTESLEFPRAAAGGILLRPGQGFALGFDALWNLDREGKTGRYGGGGEYFISTQGGRMGYPLRVGAVHDVATGTYITGGTGISSMKLGFDIAARKQVADGDELLVTASLRVFGPRM